MLIVCNHRNHTIEIESNPKSDLISMIFWILGLFYGYLYSCDMQTAVTSMYLMVLRMLSSIDLTILSLLPSALVRFFFSFGKKLCKMKRTERKNRHRHSFFNDGQRKKTRSECWIEKAVHKLVFSLTIFNWILDHFTQTFHVSLFFSFASKVSVSFLRLFVI